MKALILTRGFAQQFDYNVIESIKPWGAELHSRVAELQRLTTSPSDYDFSFVLKGTATEWSMILNCIPSKRRDFARSPLRTYLYLSGSAEEAEGARCILSLALADFWPGRYKGDDGALPHCLDAVATSDVVDGLVGWKGTEKIDAQKWSEEKLVPALLKAVEQAAQISLPGNCVGEFLNKAKTLFSGSVSVLTVLTGEYRPYLNNPEKDNPNFVFHFSESDIRTVMPDGTVKPTPPFDPRPTPVPPKPDLKPWGMPLKMTIAALLLVLVILGLRSCRSTTKEAVPTKARPTIVTPENAVSNTPPSTIKEATPRRTS